MPERRSLSEIDARARFLGDAAPLLAFALEQGRERWPELEVEAEAFVRHLARVAPDDVDPAEWLRALHAADLYLACACANGEPRALNAFDEQYLSRVPAVLASSKPASAFAEEVRQTLRVRLLVKDEQGRARIDEYAGRGPLASWIRVAILRTAISLKRTDHAHEKRRDSGPPPALSIVDPELAIIQRKYGREFNDALRRAFAMLSAEQRTVLRLHFIDGLNLADIGRVLGASRATVGRRVLDARTTLYEATAGLLRARLGLDARELESLLSLVRSKLEISLHSALAPDEERA